MAKPLFFLEKSDLEAPFFLIEKNFAESMKRTAGIGA
jgi:hypothetical protein